MSPPEPLRRPLRSVSDSAPDSTKVLEIECTPDTSRRFDGTHRGMEPPPLPSRTDQRQDGTLGSHGATLVDHEGRITRLEAASGDVAELKAEVEKISIFLLRGAPTPQEAIKAKEEAIKAKEEAEAKARAEAKAKEEAEAAAKTKIEEAEKLKATWRARAYRAAFIGWAIAVGLFNAYTAIAGHK